MVEVELQIPGSLDTESVVRIVERVCVDHGLTRTWKGTLVKNPGCTHWHFKKSRQRGTLEITWWESQNRLWFKVAENRTDTWIKESIPLLKEQIERSIINVMSP